MSENREVNGILNQIRDLIETSPRQRDPNSTETSTTNAAVEEKTISPENLTAGTGVEMGDLISTVIAAVNRTSPELLKGDRGVTLGMIIQPPGRDTEMVRDRLPTSTDQKPLDLNAFAEKAGTILSTLLTQRSSMTLPSTRRAENLAILRRYGLISEYESNQLARLLVQSDQGRSFTDLLSTIQKDPGYSPPSPFYKVFVKFIEATEDASKSPALDVFGKDTRGNSDTRAFAEGCLDGATTGVVIGALGGTPASAFAGAVAGCIAGGFIKYAMN